MNEPSLVSRYAFGTRTALFHVCSRCGAVPVVTSEIEGHVYAVVSVNAFDNVEPSLLRRAPISFDGEAVDSRLARRAQLDRRRPVHGARRAAGLSRMFRFPPRQTACEPTMPNPRNT